MRSRAPLMLFAILLSLAVCEASSLREAWKGLEAYRALSDERRTEKTLAEAWATLLAKYPYPEKIMRKPRLSPQDLKEIPRFYQRSWHRAQPTPLWGKIAPYRSYILEASRRFQVPAEIIAAVTIQESGGNPRARAPDTSAKGLMQTIDTTFNLARRQLARQGITIKDPVDPRDSILAGTWYLSYCFDLAAADSPDPLCRENPAQWARALEYYYAGPVWGRNPRPIVYVERRGKRVLIHKTRYAERVLTYARALKKILVGTS